MHERTSCPFALAGTRDRESSRRPPCLEPRIEGARAPLPGPCRRTCCATSSLCDRGTGCTPGLPSSSSSHTVTPQPATTGLAAAAGSHHPWERCRGDPTAPCPVVIAAASRQGSSWTAERPSSSVHEDRRTIDGQEAPIELWLEPGGIAFRLGSRPRLDVVCRGPEPGRLEVEHLHEGHVTLFAWNDATFTVLDACREIFVQQRPLSLDLATGETPRQRVEALHGNFARL